MRPRSNTLALDSHHAIIPVDVLLEGPKGSQFVRMALDTGATYTIAPASALRAVGHDPADSHERVAFIAAGGVEHKPRVTVRAVQALGVRLKQLPVVCHELPPQSPVRGLLGLNFLRHLDLRLDFPRHTLRVLSARL